MAENAGQFSAAVGAIKVLNRMTALAADESVSGGGQITSRHADQEAISCMSY